MHRGSYFLHELAWFARTNRGWMELNLGLALLPAVLAVALAADRRHRSARPGAVWWIGAGLFVIFLPNAPYLLTDLVHLPWEIRIATSRALVYTAVIPAFVLLAVSGFVLYAISLA